MLLVRLTSLLSGGDRRTPGPALPPAPPRLGLIGAVVAVVRLPLDVLVTFSYVVRELPYLLQDLRSTLNDVARLLHHAEPGALSELVAALARGARPRGELTRLLNSAADLAQTRADVEGASAPKAAGADSQDG